MPGASEGDIMPAPCWQTIAGWAMFYGTYSMLQGRKYSGDHRKSVDAYRAAGFISLFLTELQMLVDQL
jgi:hypothetical protein